MAMDPVAHAKVRKFFDTKDIKSRYSVDKSAIVNFNSFNLPPGFGKHGKSRPFSAAGKHLYLSPAKDRGPVGDPFTGRWLRDDPNSMRQFDKSGSVFTMRMRESLVDNPKAKMENIWFVPRGNAGGPPCGLWTGHERDGPRACSNIKSTGDATRKMPINSPMARGMFRPQSAPLLA
mmetsp:Transcript_140486/g.248095  ORF Transcript_140486/g.248095 Transcript_140486/m.248095 type:complete len:176 (-) Transcript_140486:37-564(-)